MAFESATFRRQSDAANLLRIPVAFLDRRMARPMNRTKVLLFSSYYLPGYKSGGPVRSIEGMVEQFGDECDFHIVTTDRDFQEASPYPNVCAGTWTSVGKAQVYYTPHGTFGLAMARQLVRSVKPDLIYLAGAFDSLFTLRMLLYRRLGMIAPTPVVLAAHGVFSEGALRIKSRKKRLFLALARLSGLYQQNSWHVSTEFERADVAREIGCRADPISEVFTARDLSCVKVGKSSREVIRPGRLQCLFLSRISPKKNLDGALRILQKTRCQVEFDIYGPIEDQAYWERCQQLISSLPSNVSATYHGSLPHHEVSQVMQSHDFFFLPSHGENFGHVILEALVAGCPPLVSDSTAFRGLEARKAGWDFAQSDEQGFLNAIARISSMTADEWQEWSRGAQSVGRAMLQDEATVATYRRMLRIQAA